MYTVYLISCGDDQDKKYKIGYTKRPVIQRIKQLKTGNSEELNLISEYKSKWGTKIEAVLHRNYKHLKISGEWFRLEEKQVQSFQDECKNLDNFFEDWIKHSTFKNPKTSLI